MRTYVTIVTSGDLKHLGGNTDDERASAWQCIQDEWESEILGSKLEQEINLHAQIRKLTLDIARMDMIVGAVKFYGLTDELKEQLNEEGYCINSIDELQSVVNQSKQINIRLDILKKKADAGQIADGESAVNKAMFVKMLAHFTEHFKYAYPLTLDNTLAITFCELYARYTDYIEKASQKAAAAPY